MTINVDLKDETPTFGNVLLPAGADYYHKTWIGTKTLFLFFFVRWQILILLKINTLQRKLQIS